MIVKMLHLDLVCVAAEAEESLKRLRELGAVHLDLGRSQGPEVSAAKGAAADAEKAVRAILKAREGKEYADSLNLVPCTVSDVLALASRREAVTAESDALAKEIRRLEPFGDFDPALAKSLMEAIGADELAKVVELPEELPPKRLSEMKADPVFPEPVIHSHIKSILLLPLSYHSGKLRTACDHFAVSRIHNDTNDRSGQKTAEYHHRHGDIRVILIWNHSKPHLYKDAA